MFNQGIAIILTAVYFAALTYAAPTAERLFDHPAVAGQRPQAQQGYDYASKSHPHPAWPYPSVVAAQRQDQHKREQVSHDGGTPSSCDRNQDVSGAISDPGALLLGNN